MIRFGLLFFVFLMSCSKKEVPLNNQIARISIESEPSLLDPRKSRDLASGVILRILFEGLMRSSKDCGVEKAIAASVDISDDGLQYVFHLKNTKWSDGTPLTASDFLFAWKSILDPQFPTDAAYHFYPIKNARKVKSGVAEISDLGVYALDSQTLVIELEQPTPYFLELLTMPPFFPVPEIVVRNYPNWAQEASTLVSNGPFQLDIWNHADQLTFKKNQFYWESEVVSLNEIDLYVASSDTGLRMFEENKLDWMGSPLSTIPTDAIVSLKSADRLECSPFFATGFCRLNVVSKIGEKENPLSKVEFRKALALSLDRSSIVNHILRGGQTIATSLVPVDMGLSANGYFSDNSLDAAIEFLHRARQIPVDSNEENRSNLIDSGISHAALFPSIVISYYNNERNAMIAQVLQRQWQEGLGIHVQIEAVEPKVYFQRISRKEYQIAIGSWTADFNDPINFLEVFKFKENGTNNTGWENGEYIDLLNRSGLCRDLQERKQILRKAEEILMDEMPIIPIYQFALNYVKNGALTGVSLSPQGHLDLRTASFETVNSPR